MNENEVTTLQLFYNPFADANGRTFLSFAGKTERDAYYDNQAENGKSKNISLDCYLMENDTRDIDDIYENLKGYNYARSKNALGEWVYYFITKFDYTNTDVTKITLSIDNITTYLFGGKGIKINGTIQRAHVDRWEIEREEGSTVDTFKPKYYEGSEDFSSNFYEKKNERNLTDGKNNGFVIITASDELFGYKDSTSNMAPSGEKESGIKFGDYPPVCGLVYVIPVTATSEYKTPAKRFLNYIVTGQNNYDIPWSSCPQTEEAKTDCLDRYFGFFKDRILGVYFMPFDFSEFLKYFEVQKLEPGRSYGDYFEGFFNQKEGGEGDLDIGKVLKCKISSPIKISETYGKDTISAYKYTKDAISLMESNYSQTEFIRELLETRFLYYPFSYTELKYAGASEDIRRQYFDESVTPSVEVNIDVSTTPSVFFCEVADKLNYGRRDINTSSIFSYPVYSSAWDTYISYEKALVDAQNRYSEESAGRNIIMAGAKSAIGGAIAGGGYGAALGAVAGTAYATYDYWNGQKERDKELSIKERNISNKPKTPQTSTSGNMQFINGNAEMTASDFEIPEELKRIWLEEFRSFGYTVMIKKRFMTDSDFISFIRSRHYFNYAKFSDISIIASVPNDTKQDICSKLLSGATFYKVENNSINIEEEGATEKDNIEETIKSAIGI